ncbi:MAG: molybdate ABC transporter substrate-binding protein [Lachnospiraceae bacterium]|nr:molybdate ABC transporter substrate-binding protein [Lachnospiraceae bacterium]
MTKHNLVKKAGAFLLSASMVIAMAGCGSSSTDTAEDNTEAVQQEDTKILIAAAASLEATFENELIPMFEEANPGIEVEGTYASSGDLQQQIEAGMEADVFMSAATSNMDTLVEEGIVDDATVVDLLKNDVVLIVPKDVDSKVTGFEDLQNADTVAIGDPESVPAGKYAKEILTNLGNYDAIAEKASFGTSVTEVCTWVAEGSADAGIVYSTDALNENSNGDDKEVIILATAEDSIMDTPVIYPVGVTTSSAQKEAAQKLVDFLQTEEVMNVFVENGFTANN